jgi:hypothetical protein
MTSHAPAINLGHDQPPLPNEHFSSWLRGQTTLFISQIVAILGSISLVASTIYYVRHISGDNEKPDIDHTLLTVKLIVDYLHLAFIAVFILVMIRFLDENDRGSYRVGRVYERVFKRCKPGEQEIGDLLDNGKTQLRTFKKRFLWFWIGMLCLYVSFAGQHTYEATSASRHEDGRGAAETSAKFSGSVTSDVPGAAKQEFKGEMTFSPAEERKVPDEPSPKDATTKLFFSFVDFFFNNVTLLSVYWCFLVMSIRPGEKGKAKERKYKRRSLALVGGLIVLFPLYPLYLWLNGSVFEPKAAEAYSSIFDALSGVVNAVALALLIARLDSKLVGLPSWLISILYSYAAVQPLFLVFELSKSTLLNIIATLVLIFVFIFKIYFFLIIFYALQTGKMLNYLACFPVLRTRAAEPWEATIDDRPFLTRLKEFILFSPKRLWRLVIFPLHKMTKRRETPRGGRARAYGNLTRIRISQMRERGVKVSKEFVISALRNMIKRRETPPEGRARAYGGRARAYGNVTRIRISQMCERAEMAASRLLRSRRCVKVSEVFGGVAVFHFFVSMIASQVLPETVAWGDSFQGDALFLLSRILRPPYPAPVVIGVIQALAAAAMIVILYLVSKDNDNGREGAVTTARNILDEPLDYAESIELGERQLKKFKKYFRCFWWVTLLLYVVFLIDPEMYKPITPEIHNAQVNSASAQMEDVSGFGDVPEMHNPQAEDAGVHLFGLLLFPALECCLASLNLMFIFWCFVVLRSPLPPRQPEVTCKRSEVMDKLFAERLKRSQARQRLLINYSGFIVALLIAVYPLIFAKMSGLTQGGASPRDYATVFDGVTGMLSSVVLALLIARMDSKLFNLPSSLIWMLFAYASIQTLFIAFVQLSPVLQMVKESVLIAALGLKICLFLSVAHSMQSGSVLRYLVCLPFLKERIDSIFENQFEIKLARTEEKEFTFSILKKNRLQYSTTQMFKSRKECDDAVKDIQERMKEIESYGDHETSGTHWVEVWSTEDLPHGSPPLSSLKKLLCESIPLRSKEEAHDLIDESMSKVPYCKYNRL